MIIQKTIDEIFATSRVEEVIGEFVELKKSGANLKGLSPFVDEKTPSFIVSPSKQIYKCFSSGNGGNVVSFLMDTQSMTYPEALTFLAEKYNITVEKTHVEGENEQAKDERESLFALTTFAQEFYAKQLFDEDEGRTIGLSYFKERGYNENTIKSFSLGYSPTAGRAFTDAALKNQFTEEYLLKSGLSKKGREDKLYDTFRGRVMFSIFNFTGKAIGVAGRILKIDKNAPKYVNSPENAIYHKSNELYAMNLAKQEIRKKDNCILVEGYTDVISLHQNGITNVVASSGTSLTDGQVKLISRLTNYVTILYDGDKAGVKAAIRGVQICLEKNLNPRIVQLPLEHDPDSMIKSLGASKFEEYLKENSKDLIPFLTETLVTESKNDPVKKAEAIHEIVEVIAKVPDAVKAQLFITQSSEMLGIAEKLLITEYNKIKRANTQRGNMSPANVPDPTLDYVEATEPQGEATESVDFPQEKELIRLLISHFNQKFKEDEEHIGRFILREVDDVTFIDPIFELIRKECVAIPENEELTISRFTNHANPEVSKKVIDMIATPYELSENWLIKHNIDVPEIDQEVRAAILNNIYLLKIHKVLRMIKDLEKKLKEETDPKKQSELIKMIMKLSDYKLKIKAEKGIVIL
ncbi:MAG: DNA primase [Sphingobacteriales bacterium]|jgi:DNA primase